jgi:predicted regulator of Ras-like GTPase activity (Roadblock/LC7/MglB family)
MDAQQALADLTEISSQIEAAVVFDEAGAVAGSTFGDSGQGEELARAAAELLRAAETVRRGESPLTQLEVATGEGSVFVVRDGKTCIAATTSGNPTVGLVFYDLKSALRNVKAAPAPKRRTRRTPAAAKAEPKKSTAAKKKPSTPARAKSQTSSSTKPKPRKKKDAP